MNTKSQINIKFVLNKVLKLPFIHTINLGDAVELTGEFINSLGLKDLYSYYSCIIPIVDYCGTLPDNFYEIEAIRDVATGVNTQESLGKFGLNYNNFEHQIVDRIINVHFKEGSIEVLFKGYKLDEDGFPTIPDDEQFIKGLYWYIAHHYAFNKWLLDELSETKYREIEMQHLHYMGSARYSGLIPNKTKMQSIINQQMMVTPNMNLYRDSFLDLANIENYSLINTTT